MLVGQFSNVDRANWVMCNTFYELEEQRIKSSQCPKKVYRRNIREGFSGLVVPPNGGFGSQHGWMLHHTLRLELDFEGIEFGGSNGALPLWSEQRMNAKYIMDVWKVGIRAPTDEKGVVIQEVVEQCISEVMEG
ncbi:unnamed protein product [Malus baccata var. baccata]